MFNIKLPKPYVSFACSIFACIFLIAALFYCKGGIAATTLHKTAYVAIVIDDFGNRGDGTKEMLALDIPITAAVMPFQPHSVEDAEVANNAGKEVIIHLPMEPKKGKAHWLGAKAIKCSLTDEEIDKMVDDAFAEIRWAKGMNNHMGSKAVADKRVMKIVIQKLKANNMYFLDSMTGSDSVSLEISRELEATCLTRSIFLDNYKDEASIELQMKKLGDVALKKGYAIAIGHVGVEGGKVTARAIKNMTPYLKDNGIKFVFVSDLVKMLKERE